MKREATVGVSKPHLMLKTEGVWFCVTAPGTLGWGATREAAYEHWAMGVRIAAMPAWKKHAGSELYQ